MGRIYIHVHSYIKFWHITRECSGQFENILNPVVAVAFSVVTVRPLLGGNRCFRFYIHDAISVCTKMLMSTNQKLGHNPEHQKMKICTFCITLTYSCVFYVLNLVVLTFFSRKYQITDLFFSFVNSVSVKVSLCRDCTRCTESRLPQISKVTNCLARLC